MSGTKQMTEQERAQRIDQLKKQVIAKAGSPDNLWISKSLSPEIQQRFLENILAIEENELKEEPLIDILKRDGLEVVPPDNLDDAQLTAKLWEVINAMARLRHHLERTDHLSDRELYEWLWTEILHEPASVSPSEICYIDILGGCSQEDLELNLRYYASEDDRLDWAEEFPEDTIPPHEPLPYDRDRHLP